jgi:hypothetical protein
MSAWLGSLSSQLTALEKALKQRDLIAVEKTAGRLAKLMQADWEGLFFERASAGEARLSKALARVEAKRTRLRAARLETALTQRAFAVAALVLLVSGGVLAAVAWLR